MRLALSCVTVATLFSLTLSQDLDNRAIATPGLIASNENRHQKNAKLEQKIKELIEQLGDADREMHEKAAKNLNDIGVPALGALQQAAENGLFKNLCG